MQKNEHKANKATRPAPARPDTQQHLLLAAPAPARPLRQPSAPITSKAPLAPTHLEASIATSGAHSRRIPSVPPYTPVTLPAVETKTARAKANKAAKPGVRQRLGELRGLLAEGWEIVQPIFARPLWTSPDETATAFNFVLSRAQATRLLTVPDAASVERFIRARQLVVDAR